MTSDLPDLAYVAALMSLPDLWPARLAALLGQRRARRGTPTEEPTAPQGPTCWARDAWQRVAAGRAGQHSALVAMLRRSGADASMVASVWAAAAARVDVARLWADYVRWGIDIDLLGEPGYPSVLANDETAPYVLFRRGQSARLDGRRVAIVGTRRATPAGREFATELGAGLATAGVRVVSGLALGIDGAAHTGAVAAGGAAPIGVVAGGFDLPYPARHRALWADVARTGTMVSEWPLGTRSEGWRFPARNRIIAALAEIVIVVESRESGGSMITASDALDRGISVMAVPGSVRNPASAGTNQLLRDGAAPVCSVDDVLIALSLDSGPDLDRLEARPPPTAQGVTVLGALSGEPMHASAVVIRTGLAPGEVAAELAHLELEGWIVGEGGFWQRAVGRRGVW